MDTKKLIIFLIGLLILGITINAALAATVSHTANQVLTGTFPLGLQYQWLILPGISSQYIYFNNTHLGFNQTHFNTTITALDTNESINVAVLQLDNATQAADIATNLASITSLDISNTTQSGAIAELVASNTSIDSRVDTLETNDPNDYDQESDLTTLLDDNYADISVVDTDTWNTTTDMIRAVNNTALNSSLFFDIMWANLLNVPAGLDDGDDDTTYSCSDWAACSDDSLWDADKLDGEDGIYYLDDTNETTNVAILQLDNTTQATDIATNLASITSLDISNTTQATDIATNLASITSLDISNTTQSDALTLLRTDNATQAAEIDALADTHATTLPSDNITMDVLGSPAYTTLQQWLDVTQSAGLLSGGTITGCSGTGLINVTAGQGFIKTTNDVYGNTVFFNWSDTNEIDVTSNNNTKFKVYIDYNGGNPIVAVTTGAIDFTTKISIGSVVYEVKTNTTGGTHKHLHILNEAGTRLYDLARRTQYALRAPGFNWVSGAMIGSNGLNITLTEGKFFGGLNSITTSAYDSNVTAFQYFYYNGTEWIVSESKNIIDNTYYNDVTSGLSELTSNRYGVHWVYEEVEGHVAVVYGQGDYSLANAQASQPPSSIPAFLNAYGILVGRIIVKKGAATFTETASYFAKIFPSTAASDYNDLSNLPDLTIYPLLDGTRALTDDWSLGTYGITGLWFNSSDWGNISITDDQISNLSYTVDTNESTNVAILQLDNSTQSDALALLRTDNATQAAEINALADTNESVNVAVLQLDNTTQATDIATNLASITSLDISNTTQSDALTLLRTDNTTQAAEIDALAGGLPPSTYPAANITTGTFSEGAYEINQSLTIGIAKQSDNASSEVVNGSVYYSGTVGEVPNQGAGTRFMWIPSKAAIRAGLDSGNFNASFDSNIGIRSTGFGEDPVASGGFSVAMGDYPIASGQDSVAIGYFTRATENGAVAIGYAAEARGENSIALGDYNRAYGFGSTSMGGYFSKAIGMYSVAMGYEAIASGESSYAFGREIESSGEYSWAIALNDQNKANLTAPNTFAIVGGQIGFGTLYPQGDFNVMGSILFNGTVNASKYNSEDWSNVTITESQISDLVHTTDTNESVNVAVLQLDNTTQAAEIDALSSTTNCSVTDSCPNILYETELDDLSELNAQISDATLLKSGGTLTSTKWCVYDGSGIDCNVEPVTNTWNTTTEMYDAVNNTDITLTNVTGLDCLTFISGGQICSLD